VLVGVVLRVVADEAASVTVEAQGVKGRVLLRAAGEQQQG
jgi:hypothetical protein